MQKYGFIYIWRDRKHKRYYIGCHWGHINDGYICSSRWMRRSYNRRPEDFKRRIVEIVGTDRKQVFLREYHWLQKIKSEEFGKRYYNVSAIHPHHWSTNPNTLEETRKKISTRRKGQHNSPHTEIKPGERRSPNTEFTAGIIVPHNKGKLLEQVVGVEKATKIKQHKSMLLRGKSFSPNTQFVKGQRTGIDNPKARAIATPQGVFNTLTEACEQIPIAMASLHYRLRTSKEGWLYL